TDPSFKARPNIILFGVGDATKAMLDPWVFPKQGKSPKPMRSFVAQDGVDAGVAVKQIAEVLISSVVSSAQSVTTAGGGGGFIPPTDDDLSDWL
ncbi:MAG: hypothetical protein QOE61_1364, partial [Micromonosporaceae bacterium]|nr:hypothetical protein [Micromonosporaceae bacterium]